MKQGRTKPTEQIYSNYTEEDFLVWKTLFNRQLKILRNHASMDYLNAIEMIGFTDSVIPDFKQIKEKIYPLTGWQLEVVPCLSPQKDFFKFLSQRKFTATCWIRNLDELDYIEEPDMFHDVFGHAPLLSNKQYTGFFEGIGNLALKYFDFPQVIEMLGRLYWFTIEFGLIKEKGLVKAYGAGIISSYGELTNCFSDKPVKLGYDVELIMSTSFRNDVIQEKYFIIDSYDQLFASLPDIERIIQTRI